MVIVKFKKSHFMFAFRTFESIIAERAKDKAAPFIESQKDFVSGLWNYLMKRIIDIPVSCIKAIIAGHFKMLFRDMLDKQGNKVHYGKFFFNVGIVFVLIVVESHVFAIVGINA